MWPIKRILLKIAISAGDGISAGTKATRAKFIEG